jgi:hypothetical protein
MEEYFNCSDEIVALQSYPILTEVFLIISISLITSSQLTSIVFAFYSFRMLLKHFAATPHKNPFGEIAMTFSMASLRRFQVWGNRLIEKLLPRRLTQAWWLKVKTQSPDCIYYFGPFDSKEEATFLQAGYLEDLIQEGAQNVRLAVEKACPQQLTSCAFDA